MRMVLAELLTIDAYKTADGWKWSTVGDSSPPSLFDNEVQELIALGLVAHHDGVLTLTPKGRRIATPQHDASLDTYQHTGRSLDVRGG